MKYTIPKYSLFRLLILLVACTIMISSLPVANKTDNITIGKSNIDETLFSGTFQIIGAEFVTGTIDIVNNTATSVMKIYFHSDFNISEGPDLYIYLSRNTSSSDQNIGIYIDLGIFTTYTGPFNVTFPSNININLYKSVVIYCKQFDVIFAYG